VVSAALHLVLNPDASLDDLIRFVPGPDLPGGGTILGLAGVRDAYATGRGSFRVRATARIEQVSPRRRGIVVTELPPGVGPERIIERVKDLVNHKKVQGISDLIDLTDGEHGLRLVIELAPSVNPEAMLEQLYRMTPLEDAFTINAVALVDGQPRTLGLRELLEVFVDHRREVVRRRSEHRRARARERLHLVDGLLIAIVDIDEVIQLIRTSDDTAQARERLMSVFDLTQEQASYILEMPLRRLTKFSRIELEAERDDLTSRIEALTVILEDEDHLRGVVADELLAIAEEHATPRRTILLEEAAAAPTVGASLEIEDSPCRVLLSGTGLIARTNGSDIPSGGPRAAHDVLVSATMATGRGEVAVITSAGRALRLPVVEMPILPPTAHAPALGGGAPLGALLDLAPQERVVGLAEVSDPPAVIVLGTRQGVVKRVAVQGPPTRRDWDLIALADGDEVVGAQETAPGDDIVLISSDAQALRFAADAVRPQGRSAGGMAGMRLGDGAELIACCAVPGDDPEAVIVTVAGSRSALPGTSALTAKVTALEDIPRKGRGTGGVRIHRFLRFEDVLVLGWAGSGPVRACAASGAPLDLPAGLDKRDASGTPVTGPIASVAGPPR
jgi:DNA gyrase subunit A